MKKRFYFDTSIWLDFFEARDEANLPKSKWAGELIRKIVIDNDTIIFSDNNMTEFNNIGYSGFEIEELLEALKPNLIFVESTSKQIGRSKDLAQKRDIPKRDALHALIARDNNAILITLDEHFDKLIDITKSHKPKEFI